MLRISGADWDQAQSSFAMLRAQMQIREADVEENVRTLQAEGMIVAIVDADSTVRWKMTEIGRRALQDAP